MSSAHGVVVAHPGRQHSYETARAAREAGLLRTFATGIFVPPDSDALRLLARVPRRLRQPMVRHALSRTHASLPTELVTSYPMRSLVGARLRPSSPDALVDGAIARLLRREDQPPAIVHAFEGASERTLAAARERRAFAILDVPSAHERFVAVAQEHGQCPPAAVTERVHRERRLADLLVAPSEGVVGCLAEHGVPPERIVRIPYGATLHDLAEREDDGVFRALFVGTVGARKGVSYLLEAWRLLALPRAELVLVGPVLGEVARVLHDAGSGVRTLGTLSSPEVRLQFASADVFVFPSLAEGSALAVFEAMGAGLPIVTTVESGSVVRDGIDGLLVPARDSAALAERITALEADPDRRRAMGRSARTRIASSFTWEHYCRRVGALYGAILEERDPGRTVALLAAAP